jgi:hypothetical protein
MIVAALFWLLAIPLFAKLWSPPDTEHFSWDERVIGSILIFIPVFGVLFWLLYFRRPSSHRPENIVRGSGYGAVPGAAFAAEVARHNASFPGRDIWIPEFVRKIWSLLRWPVFGCLISAVVWINSILIK